MTQEENRRETCRFFSLALRADKKEACRQTSHLLLILHVFNDIRDIAVKEFTQRI